MPWRAQRSWRSAALRTTRVGGDETGAAFSSTAGLAVGSGISPATRMLCTLFSCGSAFAGQRWSNVRVSSGITRTAGGAGFGTTGGAGRENATAPATSTGRTLSARVAGKRVKTSPSAKVPSTSFLLQCAARARFFCLLLPHASAPKTTPSGQPHAVRVASSNAVLTPFPMSAIKCMHPVYSVPNR